MKKIKKTTLKATTAMASSYSPKTKSPTFVLALTGSDHKNEDEITANYQTTHIKGSPSEVSIGQLYWCRWTLYSLTA